jgi:hypothetical protein
MMLATLNRTASARLVKQTPRSPGMALPGKNDA